MIKSYSLVLIFLPFFAFSQIKGTITDEKGIPIPYANVYEENTYNSTTANEKGDYELTVKKMGAHTLIFKSLGYKTRKTTIELQQSQLQLDVILSEENVVLNEVVIQQKENPAVAIIRSAIAAKKENSKKTNRFTADFYSKGIFKIKNLPKKIMGMKIDLGAKMESYLDSTGSGILYLSETVSKISFEKPNNFKEKIIASKIAGNNKGYSYNSAMDSNYSFYDNTVPLEDAKLISPIANNAFNYYKYKLEGTFFDENNQQINKIKVIPKRDKEPVFEGYIYIVEDSWAIYAVDFEVKGYRMNDEFTEVLQLKQNFNYNTISKLWVKNTQSIAIQAGGFGIGFIGNFQYVFSNYEFPTTFDKIVFGNELISFETNANKKENAYWNSIRPIPLTLEEVTDYSKKDHLEKKIESQKYLDSIDAINNKFKLAKGIFGYSYRNSFKKYSFNFGGLMDVNSLNFNTVQGTNLSSGFSFYKWDDETGKKTTIATRFNYGFSEDRLRITGFFERQFNNLNYAKLTVSGGTKVIQFNANEPISVFSNTISSLLFKNNYMKLYNKEFLGIQYSQDIANGVNLEGKIEYSQRKPLFNTSNFSYSKKDKLYTSNNPLVPNDYTNPVFETHHLTTFDLNATIHFGNKFIARPNGKFNIRNRKYPTLFLSYKKAFLASEEQYEFDKLETKVSYSIPLENKGELDIKWNAGQFFNSKNSSFIDYQHFNGNQIPFANSPKYLDNFLLLPYYTQSTNSSFMQLHSEYNDNGYVMNKLPLLSALKSKLVMGYHALGVPNRKPYHEFNIGLDNLGFGKFKMFRIDYVRSYQNGIQSDGFVLGLKFLGN